MSRRALEPSRWLAPTLAGVMGFALGAVAVAHLATARVSPERGPVTGKAEAGPAAAKKARVAAPEAEEGFGLVVSEADLWLRRGAEQREAADWEGAKRSLVKALEAGAGPAAHKALGRTLRRQGSFEEAAEATRAYRQARRTW